MVNIMFLFISGAEIFVVVVLAVMLFGADKVPEIARGLGKGLRQVKDATNDIKREISSSAKDANLDLDAVADIKEQVNKVRENFEDFTGPIKRTFK
ncbi:MAG: twin-arginine translocase TatA/TatE family subunit [Flavobacteriaceae bacterium]|nr:MAG: twin-arginine translocase TatA/TatE family subunit [Flavobacteriaceae bacterium]